jgi:hypothetical protein
MPRRAVQHMSTDRTPEPITRFTQPPGAAKIGGSIAIDGAGISYEIERRDGRARKGPPLEVAGDFKPSKTTAAVLVGGPHDGREARIPRSQNEYRLAAPRPAGDEGGTQWIEKQVAGRTIQQAVLRGDHGQALYMRTGELDEDGRAVFEFVEVE